MTDPVAVLIVVLLVACVLAFGFGGRILRVGVAALAAGFVLLWISPIAKLVLRPLENRFENAVPDPSQVAGVIVLGGVTERRGQTALYASGMRSLAGYSLARAGTARLVLSGGVAPGLNSRTVPEADAARKLVLDLGFPADRLVIENTSRTTRENAVNVARLVQPRQGECWALVTSAYHMPRAMAAFRAAGLDLAPFPVDFRTDGDERDVAWFSNSASAAMNLTDIALHEWLGLIWYRWNGYSRELFPEPSRTAGGCQS